VASLRSSLPLRFNTICAQIFIKLFSITKILTGDKIFCKNHSSHRHFELLDSLTKSFAKAAYPKNVCTEFKKHTRLFIILKTKTNTTVFRNSIQIELICGRC